MSFLSLPLLYAPSLYLFWFLTFVRLKQTQRHFSYESHVAAITRRQDDKEASNCSMTLSPSLLLVAHPYRTISDTRTTRGANQIYSFNSLCYSRLITGHSLSLKSSLFIRISSIVTSLISSLSLSNIECISIVKKRQREKEQTNTEKRESESKWFFFLSPLSLLSLFSNKQTFIKEKRWHLGGIRNSSNNSRQVNNSIILLRNQCYRPNSFTIPRWL